MGRYLLSIGSNSPDGAALMARAERWLATNFTDITSSGIYRSQALNRASADYYNMVARGDSPLSVTEVTALGKAFERECGRTPESKLRGCVEMDIDVIAADRTILRPEEFTRGYFRRGFDALPAE